jgi:hypothetical protein
MKVKDFIEWLKTQDTIFQSIQLNHLFGSVEHESMLLKW